MHAYKTSILRHVLTERRNLLQPSTWRRHRYSPGELMMLDRNESALHAVQLSIEGRAFLDTPNLILADIRDAETILQLRA